LDLAPHVLIIDAGVAVLSLSEWLSQLYALPGDILVGIGVVNLTYGAFSFSLAVRARRPRTLIVLLVVANATWGGLCVLTAAVLTGTASPLGLAHLVGEGVFVGGLARLEWSQREQLRTARLTSAST
jgi:hypothetical protein